MDDQYVDVEDVNGAGRFPVIPTQEHSEWKEFEKHNPKQPQEPERFVCRPRPPPEELEQPPQPAPPKLFIKVGDTWDPIPGDIVARYSLRSSQLTPFTGYPIPDEAGLQSSGIRGPSGSRFQADDRRMVLTLRVRN